MAKEYNFHRRRFAILEYLYRVGEPIHFDKIEEFCRREKLIGDARVIDKDLEHLVKSAFPVEYDEKTQMVQWTQAETHSCFQGAIVCKNMEESADLKKALARTTFNLLKKRPLSSLLLGTGTTVCYFARHLIGKVDELENHPVYLNTNNLLVLCDVIKAHKETEISVVTPQGSLSRPSCCIGDDNGAIEQFCARDVDAVVTSFFSIRLEDKGGAQRLVFTSANQRNAFEKQKNLNSNGNICPVYIPIKINSIGLKGGVEVATHEILDLDRDYTIVTNWPATQEQEDALAELWAGIQNLKLTNVKIMLTSPPDGESAKESDILANLDWTMNFDNSNGIRGKSGFRRKIYEIIEKNKKDDDNEAVQSEVDLEPNKASE